MHTWNWRLYHELPYLTCSLLDAWPHGFFTQQFSPQMPQELTQVLQPEAQIYRVKQVHGNAVVTPQEVQQYQQTLMMPQPALELAAASVSGQSEDDRPSNANLPELLDLNRKESFPPADGLVTEAAGQAVWVCSADCTPVLIGDVCTGQVAAIHSGWRGTSTRIVPAAIARLQAQGSRLTDLRIALGPAIAGEVYQVDWEVATEVVSSLAGEAAKLEHLRALPYPPVLPDPEPGKARLDVRRVIALQLEALGIAEKQVAIAPHCTYQQPEFFFSYRRDRLKQVQWSGIVSISLNG